MTPQRYAFKVGTIDCWVLLDDYSVTGKERILRRFPDAAEADYRQAYAEIGLSLDEADDSLNVLLAKIGADMILVDTGQGGNPHGGYLVESMRLAGIAPEAVTQVVITHTHGDHVMGALTDDGQPVFPNATYIITREELQFWRERIEGEASAHRPILTMMEAKGLRVIAMDEQIAPGMTAVSLPGHTPGHIGLLLESGNDRLFHLADQLHSPMQFAHPEWSITFDVDTSVSVPVRRDALGRAADETLLTLFYHLTFPGLGWVKRAENGFSWEALASLP
jgi:glyoxylase-like metal-dependent hydrolase (beta-lactamase superfamily II)